jgi:hypothetical protein
MAPLILPLVGAFEESGGSSPGEPEPPLSGLAGLRWVLVEEQNAKRNRDAKARSADDWMEMV